MTGITPELLIRLARTTLTEDVLGQEADAVKYPVLMIANALAIAARKLIKLGRGQQYRTGCEQLFVLLELSLHFLRGRQVSGGSAQP